MRGEATSYASRSWPTGWRQLPLAKVGKWLSGGTPSTSNDAYWGGEIPWISGASMKHFHVADSARRLTLLGAKNGSRLVEPGTTLFVVRGMSLKSEFRIGVAERQVAFGQDCKAVIPIDGIDPYFLAYAIRVRTPEILSMVEETSHGTGRLDTVRLQELEIGIPPMEEQHRIVAAHAAFERRISAMERVLAKLKAVSDAVAVRAMATAPGLVPLGTWLQRIEAGKSPMAEDTPAGDGQWGVLKVSAVQPGWFKEAENKVIHDSSLINPQYEVRPGDLIMTRANTEQLVGLACIARTPPPRLMLSDKTLRLVPDQSVADAQFIELTLLNPAVRMQIRAMATGTSGSMKNIGQEAVRQLLVPDVPTGDQKQVVAAVAASRKRAESVTKQIEKTRIVQQAVAEDLLSGKAWVSEPE
ncbi:restriction endonuclease subunit S [Streptomyces sp. NPDC056653]|uniref:restriction endonuclease subunit S n=1 Tax=Streptomyces sp. NPDC056653 TaxID=3345894 RepID=UPI0036C9B426